MMITRAHTEIDPTAQPEPNPDSRTRLVVRNSDSLILGVLNHRRRRGWTYLSNAPPRLLSRKGFPTPGQAVAPYNIMLTPWVVQRHTRAELDAAKLQAIRNLLSTL